MQFVAYPEATQLHVLLQPFFSQYFHFIPRRLHGEMTKIISMALKTCMSVAFWEIELECDVYNLQSWINNNIFLMRLIAPNFVIFL